MKDQPKTPGAMVQITHEQLRDLVAGYCGSSALGELYALADSPAEQTPAVAGQFEVEVWQYYAVGGRDAEYTYREEVALQYDKEPTALIDRAHLAPLLAEIEQLKHRNGMFGLELSNEFERRLKAECRIAELEAQIAKANDWSHLKPDMDPPKP